MWGRVPTLLFCMWISSCPCIICWKGYSFSIGFSWHLCQKSIGCKYDASFFLFWIFPFIYILSCASTTLSWLFQLCSEFEIKKYVSSNFFVVVIQHCFNYSGLLEFSYIFWVQLVKFYKVVCWDFFRDWIESVGDLRNTGSLHLMLSIGSWNCSKMTYNKTIWP